MKKQAGMAAVAVAAFIGGAALMGVLPQSYGQAPAVKGAKLQHGFNLAVRAPSERDVTKDTKRFGVEMFRDENNGNLIYISETGSIAVLPAK